MPNNIIKHTDYNAPVNNDTVLKDTFGHKLFKITEGIYINPSDRTHESLTSNSYLEDMYYCNTDAKKSIYLKQISKLFERIGNTNNGKKILNLISKGTPLVKQNLPTYKTFTAANSIKLDNDTFKPFSVVISPPYGNIDAPKTIVTTNMHDVLTSSSAKILIAPDTIKTLSRSAMNSKGDLIHTEQCIDPAVILEHELVHAMHYIYGVIDVKFMNDPHFPTNIEEYITHGGTDRANIEKEINETLPDLRKKLENTAELINNKISLEQDKKYFAEKYMLENIDGKYTVTQDSFEKFKYNMYDACSEFHISKELNLPTRSTYTEKLYIPRYAQIENDAVYSAKQGFVKGIHTFVNKDIKEHPNMLEEKKKGLPNNIIFGCRPKRATESSCNINLEENDLILFEERLKEFPNKLLQPFGYNNSTQKINTEATGRKINVSDKIKNDIISDSLPLEININNINTESFTNPKTKKEMIELSSWETGYLIPNKNITNKDLIQSHNFYKDLDPKTTAINFLHSANKENFYKAMNSETSILTHNKKLSINMSDVFKGANKVANVAGVFMWAKTIFNDFTEEHRAERFHSTFEDGLHTANDILTIVPYVGIGMNIGVDIHDGNYAGATINLGIFLLLEAFPELMLPLMIFGFLKEWYDEEKKEKHTREIIHNNIINLLSQSNDLIDLSAVKLENNFADTLHNRVIEIAKTVITQQKHNLDAISHNILHLAHKVSKSPKDIEKVEDYIVNQKMIAEIHINRTYKAIIKTLYTRLTKVFIEDYKKVSTQQMQKIDDDVRKYIKNILASKDPAINTTFVDNMLNEVNEYLKEHNIAKKLDDQIKIIKQKASELENNTYYENFANVSLISQNSKIKDANTLSNISINNVTVITDEEQDYEGEMLFKSEDNSSLIITNPLFNKVKNFTLSFLIKIPLVYRVLESAHTILEVEVNKETTFSIGIRKSQLVILNYNNRTNNIVDIDINKWELITFSYDNKKRTLYCYRDNKLIFTSNNLDSFLGDQISINIDKSSLMFYKIAQFQYYCETFEQKDVETLYSETFQKNRLYDITRAPLKAQKRYRLINKYAKKDGLIIDDITLKTDSNKNKKHYFYDFYDRKGLEVKLYVAGELKYDKYTKTMKVKQIHQIIDKSWVLPGLGTKINVVDKRKNYYQLDRNYSGVNEDYKDEIYDNMVICIQSGFRQLGFMENNIITFNAYNQEQSRLRLFKINDTTIGIATSKNNSINGIVSSQINGTLFISQSSYINSIPDTLNEQIPFNVQFYHSMSSHPETQFQLVPIDDFWTFQAKE